MIIIFYLALYLLKPDLLRSKNREYAPSGKYMLNACGVNSRFSDLKNMYLI